jgi:RTX calcium-binding nonapeptide repeat (4 copies)
LGLDAKPSYQGSSIAYREAINMPFIVVGVVGPDVLIAAYLDGTPLGKKNAAEMLLKRAKAYGLRLIVCQSSLDYIQSDKSRPLEFQLHKGIREHKVITIQDRAIASDPLNGSGWDWAVAIAQYAGKNNYLVLTLSPEDFQTGHIQAYQQQAGISLTTISTSEELERHIAAIDAQTNIPLAVGLDIEYNIEGAFSILNEDALSVIDEDALSVIDEDALSVIDEDALSVIDEDALSVIDEDALSLFTRRDPATKLVSFFFKTKGHLPAWLTSLVLPLFSLIGLPHSFSLASATLQDQKPSKKSDDNQTFISFEPPFNWEEPYTPDDDPPIGPAPSPVKRPNKPGDSGDSFASESVERQPVTDDVTGLVVYPAWTLSQLSNNSTSLNPGMTQARPLAGLDNGTNAAVPQLKAVNRFANPWQTINVIPTGSPVVPTIHIKRSPLNNLLPGLGELEEYLQFPLVPSQHLPILVPTVSTPEDLPIDLPLNPQFLELSLEPIPAGSNIDLPLNPQFLEVSPAPTPTGINTAGNSPAPGTGMTPNDDNIFIRNTLAEPKWIDGSGGNQVIEILPSDRHVIIDNFGGVGTGTHPSSTIVSEVDTLKFTGVAFTPQNMLLNQIANDLVIEFAEAANTRIILRNFQLENLDNFLRPFASASLANIWFNGEGSTKDSFDVFDMGWGYEQVFNRDTTTFLNDLDNWVSGLDASNDVINGQGGNDVLLGLSGDDILRGGFGNDVLIGGAGTNILMGNAGHNTFAMFTNGFSKVLDFVVGYDWIGLPNEISFEQVQIQQGTGVSSNDTWIAWNDTPLLQLEGIQANTLTSNTFVHLDLSKKDLS